MLELLINALNVKTLTALFAGLAAAATVLTLAMPFVFVDPLDKRMCAVALEREKIRQRERERLARKGRKPAPANAETIYPNHRRALQPKQVGGPGRSAPLAHPGRISRSGALRDLPVFPHGYAGGVFPVRAALSVVIFKRTARMVRSAPYRRSLCRHVVAADAAQEQDSAPAVIHQTGIPRHVGPASDLR